MVLVGATRVGKSSSGNTILGTNAFNVEQGFEKCDQRRAEVDGRSVVVTDTPGWDRLCAEDTPRWIKDEILASVSLCSPGPHAFLLVIPAADITERQREGTEHLLASVGAAVWRHTIVLLTWGTTLGSRSVEEFLETQPPLKSLVARCGGRVLALDNKACVGEAPVADLLRRVEDLIKENCGLHFSMDVNYMYSKLKSREKELEDLKHQYEVQVAEKDRSVRDAVVAKEDEIQDLRSRYEGTLKEKDRHLEELRLQSQEMMEKASEMEALKEQLENMTSTQLKLEQLEQLCATMAEEEAGKVREILQLRKNLRDQEKVLEDKEKDVAKVRLQNEEEAKSRAQAVAELEKTEEMLLEARHALDEMKATCQQLEVRCEEKERDLHRARECSEELSDQIRRLEQLCEHHRQKLGSLKVSLGQKESEIRDFQLKHKVLQDKNLQSEERLRETQQVLRERESQLDEVKKSSSRSLRHLRLYLESVTRDLKEKELDLETDESKLLLAKRRSSREFTHPNMSSDTADSSRGSSRSHSELFHCRKVQNLD